MSVTYPASVLVEMSPDRIKLSTWQFGDKDLGETMSVTYPASVLVEM